MVGEMLKWHTLQLRFFFSLSKIGILISLFFISFSDKEKTIADYLIDQIIKFTQDFLQGTCSS